MYYCLQFNTLVEDVDIFEDKDLSVQAFPKFTVTSKNLTSQLTSSEVFDGVMVCNGYDMNIVIFLFSFELNNFFICTTFIVA